MQTRLLSTWALGALALVLGAALAGATLPAQAASRGALQLRTPTVASCGAAKVAGTVGKGPRSVRLQLRRPGGSWQTVDRRKTGKSGRFSTAFLAPSGVGGYDVRALAPKAKVHGKRRGRVVTNAVRLTVVSATGAGAFTPAECTVLRLTNAQRVKAGCRPLVSEPRLRAAAKAHSDEMAARGVLSHTSADGRTPSDRISATGYRWTAWGENVAYHQATPSEVVQAWMHSPPHRANILTCVFTELGVGMAVDGGGHAYWTQDFGRR